MKSSLNILVFCLTIIMFASCSHEESDLFEQSSATRMEQALEQDKTILTNASNGWLMQYYPSSTQQYGGYNILTKFNTDGSVVVASDVYNASSTATSTYSLSQSAGVILSFDSYNDIMHFFSDPVNPAGVGTNGKGMQGDLEFRLIEVSADKIVMLGKKTNSRIVMTPLGADVVWKDYLTSIAKSEKDMTYFSYLYVVGDFKAQVKMNFRTMNITYDKNGVSETINAPYIVTPTGYQLYDTLSLGGAKVTYFTYKGGDANEFVSDDNSGAKMYGLIPNANEWLVSGTRWYFSYDNLGPVGKSRWDKAIKALYTKKTQTLTALYFANNGMTFITDTNSKGTYTFKSEFEGTDKITLTMSGYDPTAYIYPLMVRGFNGFINIIFGSFTATVDDAKNPTTLKLVDTTNPFHYMVLTRTPVVPYTYK
jgi:hypothetical protein